MKQFDLFGSLGNALNPTFYNTNQTTEPDLSKAVEKDRTQQKKVYNLFTRNHNWTPSMIWEQLIAMNEIDRNTPLTSIRRAMTNLKNSGHIEKTDEVRPGYYGKNEHYYKLRW